MDKTRTSLKCKPAAANKTHPHDQLNENVNGKQSKQKCFHRNNIDLEDNSRKKYSCFGDEQYLVSQRLIHIHKLKNPLDPIIYRILSTLQPYHCLPNVTPPSKEIQTSEKSSCRFLD